MVLKQKHTPDCTIRPGVGEHHISQGVKSDEGPLRLTPEQERVQADKASLPRDECRSLRVLINVPTSKILQLES